MNNQFLQQSSWRDSTTSAPITMTTYVSSWMTLNKKEKGTMCLSLLRAFLRWQTTQTLQIPSKRQMGKTALLLLKVLLPFGCSYLQKPRKKNLKPNWRETMHSPPLQKNSVSIKQPQRKITEERPQSTTDFNSHPLKNPLVTGEENHQWKLPERLLKGKWKIRGAFYWSEL